VEGAQALVAVLAKLGVKDERIFEAICEMFEEDLVLGSLQFGDYGDPNALPYLEDAIADFEPDFSSLYSRMDLTELLDAHERLGGVLNKDLKARVHTMDETWKQRVAAPAPSRGHKVGRNDPCPCGSGKKFKKCCLGKPTEGTKTEAVSHGDGPARQFVEFAQPLLDLTDGSDAATQEALNLAQLVWNVAVTPDEAEREVMLAEALSTAPEEERAGFEKIARSMLKRHHEMFPEMAATRSERA
jgi:hypothetical protein